MLKQTLFFSSAAKLSLKNQQLIISWKDSNDIISRPIEDLGFVILECQMISISLPLINELVKNNVCIIICNNKGMPSSIVQGLENNTIQAENIKKQVAISDPTKKQAWKQIVEQKIKNQAALLNKVGESGELLKHLYTDVKSGDTTNREGLAARQYWPMLFGKDFKRDREGEAPNSLLNYGYSILRAATTRALLGAGLLPALGVFHRNRYNSFPLADDLMEPFRPYVDEIAYYAMEENYTEIDKETKARMFRLLFTDVSIANVVRPLQLALTISAASLVKYYKGEIKTLTLPHFK